MLTTGQFRVNEAWIAVRINDDNFLFVKTEPYDVYLLMDAASTYVLGNVLSRVIDGAPNEKDLDDLFKNAWAAKKEWPEILILVENDTALNDFKRVAEINDIPVKILPLSDLEPIVGPLKKLFAASLH
jgi:hypothetical protein